MGDRLDELGANTEVALVTFTAPESLADYLDRNDLPFPVLRDSERDTYRMFGLGRGTIRRIWGWRAGLRYLELFRENRLHGWQRATDDTLQLGGDFVIAPDGTLAWGFWGDGPDDRPDVDELIAAISAAQ